MNNDSNSKVNMTAAGKARLFGQLAEVENYKKEAHAAGEFALYRLLPIALDDTGQSRIVGRFLLGCYNSSLFPFPLDELRRLDMALHKDCMAVLAMDWSPKKEVHQYFGNGSEIFEGLAKRFGGQS